MAVARVINRGKEQFLTFPKEIMIRTKQVEIFRRGTDIVVRERKTRSKNKTAQWSSRQKR